MRSEKEIIKGCLEGNKASQFELVKRYSRMLLSVCRRYAHNDAFAKDILQESWDDLDQRTAGKRLRRLVQANIRI